MFSEAQDLDELANFLYYFIQETLFAHITAQDPNFDIDWPRWNNVDEARAYAAKQTHGVAHWCCHARMGKTASDAVADPEGRVFGVKGLRVAGVAALPFLPDSTPAAHVAMASLKIAEFIISDR